jgi:hypothetical protein
MMMMLGGGLVITCGLFVQAAGFFGMGHDGFLFLEKRDGPKCCLHGGEACSSVMNMHLGG